MDHHFAWHSFHAKEEPYKNRKKGLLHPFNKTKTSTVAF